MKLMCAVLNAKIRLLKSHLLNAFCAPGLKALNDSHHSDDSFLHTE